MRANRQLRRQATNLRQRLAQHGRVLGTAGETLRQRLQVEMRNPAMLPRAFVAGFLVDQCRPLLGRLAVSAAATGTGIRHLRKLASSALKLLT